MMMGSQVREYYRDLTHKDFASALRLFISVTAPTLFRRGNWPSLSVSSATTRINTLRGNLNQMRAGKSS